MEHVDLNESYIFTRVVQAGSFIRASEMTGIPKQTVSAKVASLEERLGVTLLRRTTRKLSLTEAGAAFYRKALEGLQLLEAAQVEATRSQEQVRGPLRVSAPLDFSLEGLKGIIQEFTRRYPETEVSLIFSDRYVDLISEGVDVAIRAGALTDSSMIAKKLGFSTFIPVASPKYLKNRGEIDHPKDLEKRNCLRSMLEPSTPWKFRRGREKIEVRVSGNVSANHLLFLRELALADEGIALLPSGFCYPDIEKGRLVRLLPDWIEDSEPIHAVYPAQRFVPPQLQAFLSVLVELAERLLPEVRRR